MEGKNETNVSTHYIPKCESDERIVDIFSKNYNWAKHRGK